MMSRRRNERTWTSGSVLFARAFLPSFSPARENNNEKKKIKKKWTEENERRGKRRRRRAAAPGRSRLSSFFSPSLFPFCLCRSFVLFFAKIQKRQNSTKTLNTKIQKMENQSSRTTTQQTARAPRITAQNTRRHATINRSIGKSWVIQPSLARTRKTKATCTAKPDEAKDRTDQTLRTSAWPRRRLWRSRERKTLWRKSWGTTYRAKKAKSSSGGW